MGGILSRCENEKKLTMSISGTSTRDRPVSLRIGEYQQYDPARL